MKNALRYLSLCFLLLLGAHLLGAPGGAETDSTRGRYPLNDPRNPDCPCHKYQEQADREYAKLFATNQKTMKTQAEGQALVEHKTTRRIRARNWFRIANQSHKMKGAKRKCFRDRLSRCFHF
jgi:hypothetical protein